MADKTVLNLPKAGQLSGNEVLYAIQSGVDAHLTLEDIANYIMNKKGLGGTPAPAFTTRPSISPSNGAAGDTFSGDVGQATDATTYSRRWFLAGTAIGTGVTVVPQIGGELMLEVTAVGPGGSTVATSGTVVVAPAPAPAPTLAPLTGSFSLPENASAGAIAGSLAGRSTGSTLSLVDDAGGRVALSGTQVVRGAQGLDYETAAKHTFTVRETLSGATNSPRDTVLSLTVTDLAEQPSLSALSLDDTSVTADSSSTIRIIGATTGSTLAVQSGALPAGMTLDSAARTISGAPTQAATAIFTLRETLAGSVNSPRDTQLSITVETKPVIVPEEGVAELITTLSGGRDPKLGVPQSYHDIVALQAQDHDHHPHLGARTHNAVKSGNWSDPTVWDTGTVPAGGAVVEIGGHSVTFDVVMSTGSYADADAMLTAYRTACDTLATKPDDAAALDTIGAIEKLSIRAIHCGIAGTFRIAPDVPTLLLIDTLFCMGSYEAGTIDAPIAYAGADAKPGHRCIFIGTGDPGTTTKIGLMTMGKMRMCAEPKTPYLKYALAPTKGATQVTLESPPVNWRVGDTIVITSTSFAGRATTDPTYTGPTQAYVPSGMRFMDRWWYGNNQPATSGKAAFPSGSMRMDYADTFKRSHDEVRAITAINGAVVQFGAPLAYDHPVHSGRLPDGKVLTIESRCANLSSSLRYEGAYVREKGVSGTGRHRAHTMHMHHDDVVRSHPEFKNMGRSRIDPSLFSAENDGETKGCLAHAPADASDVVYLADASNVRARYAVHDHWTGPYFARRPVISKGVRIWSEPQFAPTPGWAYTHHASRSFVHDLVTFNTRGAGLVSELGSEIGQWIDCLSIWNRGDGYEVNANQYSAYGDRQEYISNHNGHAGVAFENQAREVLVQGCIGVSSNYGAMYYLQRTSPFGVRSPADTSLRYRDPLVQGQASSEAYIADFLDKSVLEVYGHEQVQIRDWHDNEFADCDVAFYVAHRDAHEENETMPMLAHGFRALSEKHAYRIPNYSFNYFFKDVFIKGKSGTSRFAIWFETKTYNLNFKNVRVDDYSFALRAYEFNYNGFYVDFNGNAIFDAQGNPRPFEFHTADPTFGFTIPYGATAANGPITNHPSYGVMGPWTEISTTGTSSKVKIRNHDLLTEAQMPQPYPSARFVRGTTAEPAPGTPKPYFYFDHASTSAVTPTAKMEVTLRGRIVDSWGVRAWPSIQRFQSYARDGTDNNRRNDIATGAQLVQRNGCWLDGKQWKMTLWFIDADRGTHEYLVWSHTVPLSGFDPAFLQQHQVAGPDATKPQVPVAREAIPAFARV